MENLVVYILLTFIVFLEVLHYRERSQLYTRLMAKNLSDFSSHEAMKQKPKIRIPDTQELEPLVRL